MENIFALERERSGETLKFHYLIKRTDKKRERSLKALFEQSRV